MFAQQPGQQQQRQQQQQHRPPTPGSAAFNPSQQQQRRPGSAGGYAPPQQQQQQQQQLVSPEMTTYSLAFNMRDNYPEVFDRAVAQTRSEPAPNFNFTSDWGDSLKAAVDAEWRRKFMKSTYTAANDEVVTEPLDFDKTKERAFFEWMQKQKTYYGDLLAQDPKANMEASFAEGSLEQKRDMLNGLRQVSSVARPDDLKSHSQAVHRPMVKTESASLTALMTEQIRIKTMGKPLPMVRAEDLPPPGQPMPPQGTLPPRPSTAAPTKVEITFQQGGGDGGRPFTAGPRPGSSGAGGGGGGVGGGRPHSASELPLPTEYKRNKARKPRVIETHVSKVPLSWPGFQNKQHMSAYTEAFGAVGQVDAPRPASGNKQYQPIRIKSVTCPIGAVDPHTSITKARSTYPVPDGLVQRLPFPYPADDKTTYRTDYYTRDEADTVRSVHDAARTVEMSRAAWGKVTLPLGKNGYDTLPSKQWVTDYDANFTGPQWDVAEDRARAERLKAALSGPTASTGRLTAKHMSAADRRAEREGERAMVEHAMTHAAGP